MVLRSRVLQLLIASLVIAGVACNTVSRLVEGSDGDVVEATVEAIATDAPPPVATLPIVPEELEATAEAPEEPAQETEPEDEATPMFGDPPEDVPVWAEGDVEDFFATEDIVSYSTEADLATVSEFYKAEMEANGWELQPDSSFEMEGSVLLSYAKDGRSAMVTLTADSQSGGTLVLVSVSEA